jgi:hypothetical protein
VAGLGESGAPVRCGAAVPWFGWWPWLPCHDAIFKGEVVGVDTAAVSEIGNGTVTMGSGWVSGRFDYPGLN